MFASILGYWEHSQLELEKNILSVEDFFIDNFRVSYAIFNWLSNVVSPVLSRADNYKMKGILLYLYVNNLGGNKPMCSNKLIAIALKRLASGDSFASLAALFNVALSTVEKAIYSFCIVTNKLLEKKLILYYYYMFYI